MKLVPKVVSTLVTFAVVVDRIRMCFFRVHAALDWIPTHMILLNTAISIFIILVSKTPHDTCVLWKSMSSSLEQGKR